MKPMDYQTRSFQFACQIVRFYRVISRENDVPAPIARQLLRSGCSIGANLEEARSAQSRLDLVSKFSIAEAGELVAILTTSLKRLKSQ